MNTHLPSSWRPGNLFDVNPRVLSVLSLFLLTACGSSDCGCDGFEQRDFPAQHYDKTQAQGAQVRITKTGFDFIENNADPIIKEVLPDGLSFCIPKDDQSSTKLCQEYNDKGPNHKKGDQPKCDDGSDGCQLDLTVEKMELTPVPSNQLDVAVTLNIADEYIPIERRLLVNVKCDIRLRGDVTGTIPVAFNIVNDSPLKDVSIDVGDVKLDLDKLKYSIEGGFGCDLLDLGKGLFGGTIENLAKSELKKVVDEQVKANLCQACGNMGDEMCPNNSTCRENICVYDGSEQCVPTPLGVEGRLDIGSFLQGFSEGENPKVDLIARAADFAETDPDGLTLALRSGFQPVQIDRCAPVDVSKRPGFGALPISNVLKSGVKPGSNEPFMLGIALHKQALDHVFWSAWASGGTCLKIDSSVSEFLSVKSLTLFLRGLRPLSLGENGGAELKVSPQQPPVVKLGKNLFEKEGDKLTVKEGLIIIDWKDVDLHMYGWVYDRWTRLFTLRVDLEIPLAMIPDGMGKLSLVVGDLEDGIKNVRASDGEITQATAEDLAMLVPTLVGAALPSLASSLEQTIDIPSFSGFTLELKQGDITSIENNTFLAIFGNLAPAPMMPTSGWVEEFAPKLQVLGHKVTYPKGEVIEGPQQPVVALDVLPVMDLMAGEIDPSLMDVSWRVDGGLWAAWQGLGALKAIDSPSFMLPGMHKIELRLRAKGADHWRTTSVSVPIDYQAPELQLNYDESKKEVILKAADMTDHVSQLRYRHRIHNGSFATVWSEWSAKKSIDVKQAVAAGSVRVEAQVRDQSGKVTAEDYTIYTKVASATSQETATSEPKAGGCSSTPGQSGNSSPLLLMLLGSVLLGLRRRSGILALLGLMTAGVVGCSDDDVGANKANFVDEKVCDPACETGFSCVAGKCEMDTVVNKECTEPSDCSALCGDNKIPSCSAAGTCLCADACGDGCGDTQFCCVSKDMCQEIPDPCDGKVCDPGLMPGTPVFGTVDNLTCQIQGASCECVKAEPLSLGLHGMYGSIASRDGKTVLSVYSLSYGDLMVGVLPASGSDVAWQFAAGVPSMGKISGATDGPRGGLETPGEDLGRYTATVIDPSGNVVVLFQHGAKKTLHYVVGKPSGEGFDFGDVVDVDAEGKTGYWNRAVVDASGNVHAVYHVRELDKGGSLVSQLRYVQLTSDGNGGFSAGTPEVVLEGEAKAADDMAPISDGVESGSFLDLVLVGEEMLLTFYDGKQKSVGWSKRKVSESAWAMPKFLGAGTGPYVSGMLDASGKVHLAYMKSSPDTLVYEEEGAMPQVIADDIRDTGTARFLARVGEGVLLRLGSNGKPSVVYQDATLHKFISAVQNDQGNWTRTEISEPGTPYSGAHGFFGTMLRGQDQSSIAIEYVIDGSKKPLESFPLIHTLP